MVQSSRRSRMMSFHSKICWYVASGHGPLGVPEWQGPEQRSPKIGATFVNVGGGDGQAVGACKLSQTYEGGGCSSSPPQAAKIKLPSASAREPLPRAFELMRGR